MRSAARIVREARLAAGLTQAELARRMGTTQSAVARLEREGANPRLASLERAVRATGRHLEIDALRPPRSVDETLIARRLRMTPAERLLALAEMRHAAGILRRAGTKARGAD